MSFSSPGIEAKKSVKNLKKMMEASMHFSEMSMVLLMKDLMRVFLLQQIGRVLPNKTLRFTVLGN